MALTLPRLQELLKAEGLLFYVAPDRPVVRLGVAGMFGRYEMVVHLENEGQFLQFRTVGYMTCPATHPNLAAVLRAMAAINYRNRFVKFGWDQSDGEIAGYGDMWVVDGDVTPQQFSRMMHNFVPAIDTSSARLKETMTTGRDPGDEDPIAMLARTFAGNEGALPPELRKLVEQLRGAKPTPPAKGPDEISEI
jgi:hypothetical protein